MIEEIEEDEDRIAGAEHGQINAGHLEKNGAMGCIGLGIEGSNQVIHIDEVSIMPGHRKQQVDGVSRMVVGTDTKYCSSRDDGNNCGCENVPRFSTGKEVQG